MLIGCLRFDAMPDSRLQVDKLERVVTASKAIFEVLNGSAEGSPYISGLRLPDFDRVADGFFLGS